MNVHRKQTSFSIGSAKSFVDSLCKKAPEPSESIPKVVPIFRPSTEIFKRRVQIPLPRGLDQRIARVQERFGLRSNSLAIQVALGLTYHLIKLQRQGAVLVIEDSQGRRRPLNAFALFGHFDEALDKIDGVTKYQITIDPDQEEILNYVSDALEASSLAETVRFSLRVLDSLGEYIAQTDQLLGVLENEEVLLDLE
jgi:hypothetical protein